MLSTVLGQAEYITERKISSILRTCNLFFFPTVLSIFSSTHPFKLSLFIHNLYRKSLMELTIEVLEQQKYTEENANKVNLQI